MPRIIRPCFWLLAALPLTAAAALAPPMQDKVQALARESDALFRQVHKWEGVQQAMLKQKQQIEATQDEINRESTALSEKSAEHNRQVALQQHRVKDDKADCGAGKSSGQVSNCDQDAKSMNAQSADLNAENATLKSEQDALDAKYAKANQDASDWNAREQTVVQHMNTSYRALNDWLDRAYGVVTDSDFRDAVTAAGADGACENRGLPAGTVSIDAERRLGLYYRGCLKAVLAARAEAAPAAAGHRP